MSREPLLMPISLLDLLDAPSGARVVLGAHCYVKGDAQSGKPWRIAGQRVGLGSQVLWERWCRQQTRRKGEAHDGA